MRIYKKYLKKWQFNPKDIKATEDTWIEFVCVGAVCVWVCVCVYV